MAKGGAKCDVGVGRKAILRAGVENSHGTTEVDGDSARRVEPVCFVGRMGGPILACGVSEKASSH